MILNATQRCSTPQQEGEGSLGYKVDERPSSGARHSANAMTPEVAGVVARQMKRCPA